MTVSLSLLVAAAVLNAVGATLLLTRSLTRILLGAVVLGNGVNLLVLAATGSAGEAPCSTRTSSATASPTRCPRPSP